VFFQIHQAVCGADTGADANVATNAGWLVVVLLLDVLLASRLSFSSCFFLSLSPPFPGIFFVLASQFTE